jgi:hypothetical protein
MTQIPNLPPAVLASADQWLAGGTDSMAGPLAQVREAIASKNTEARLASVAIALSVQAIEDPQICQGLAAGYILSLYELARAHDKLAHFERLQRDLEAGWKHQ